MKRARHTRIVYGIQSTGKSHLLRFLGLKPFFDRDGARLCYERVMELAARARQAAV